MSCSRAGSLTMPIRALASSDSPGRVGESDSGGSDYVCESVS